MNKLSLFSLAVMVLMGFSALAGAKEPQIITGKATVIDGDTLRIGAKRIRLYGIDAPEMAQECQLKSLAIPCGKEARQRLIGLIEGAPITCQVTDRDDYGRLVAKCKTGSGLDLNRAMVAAGYALAYRRYSSDYIADEEAAKSAGLGLWAMKFLPPWEWRRYYAR